MRLNWRRVQPGALFNSFLGILDIKLGCEIILLFGLINKVAGVYGLITVFVGGSPLQFLFYAYSVASLFVFLWSLSAIKSETAHKTLLAAHLYTADHVIQSVFHYLFYYNYWYVQAHDGKRTINSQAQTDIVDLATSRHEVTPMEDDELRTQLALQIWNHEKGYALGLIVFGFLLKLYFLTVLYSYAAHLRSSTYHTLSYTTRVNGTSNLNGSASGRPAAPLSASADQAGDDDRELANAEAEVARMADEGASGSKAKVLNGKAKAGKKDDDDDDFNWD